VCQSELASLAVVDESASSVGECDAIGNDMVGRSDIAWLITAAAKFESIAITFEIIEIPAAGVRY
jgi:hypothetical protein